MCLQLVSKSTIFVIIASLNENENEKCTYIFHFSGWAKIDENVVVFVTHDVIHGPLNTTRHLIQIEL
jgi:hypothetical protein